MGKIWLISDLHFGHAKEFVVDYRGFSSIEEHDDTLVKNWNSLVDDEDDVYLLGDVAVGNAETGYSHLAELKGKIHIVRGNHDTDEKCKRYLEMDNVVELADAKYLRYGSITLFLCHFPTLVSHDKLKRMKNAVINLYGHTHQKDSRFYMLNYGTDRQEAHPYMYCVCADCHDMSPVLLDDIIEEVRAEKNNYDGRHQND